jgi:3-hydroxyisobutyrate dehydrogenase
VRVGLVGIGRMGGAIAQRLLDTGHEVIAHDVRGDAVAALAAHPSGRACGARSGREVAQQSDLVGIAVLDDAQLLDALLGPHGVLAGSSRDSIVLVHSTVAPGTLRRAGDEATACGVPLLEAAVSGASGHRSVGQLCVMVGGERAAFERARPMLEAIGSLVLHLGPLGAGLDAKLVRNAIAYQQFLAGYEGCLLAEALGIARADVLRILQHTGVLGPNLASFLDERPSMAPFGPRDAERRRFFEATAATARKDLAAALARAREVGLELPAIEHAASRMDAAFGVGDPCAQPEGT